MGGTAPDFGPALLLGRLSESVDADHALPWSANRAAACRHSEFNVFEHWPARWQR